MKKVRKSKGKKMMFLNSMTSDERTAYELKKGSKTVKEKIDLAIWDHTHGQLNGGKKAELRSLIPIREKELKDEEEYLQTTTEIEDKSVMWQLLNQEKAKLINAKRICEVE